MSNAPITSPPDQPGAGRRRLHPLAIGLLSTAVSLAAAAGAAAIYSAVSPSGTEPEVAIRLTAEDAEGAPVEPFVEPDVTGRPLPDVTFDLLGGGEAAFADYRGRPLVVNVWSSTCAPCLEEMPALEEVSVEHGDHVTFLGLVLLDEPDAAQATVDETGVTYDIGLDRTGAIAAEIEAVGLPSTLFVDAEGRVTASKTGVMTLDEIRSRVEDLLG